MSRVLSSAWPNRRGLGTTSGSASFCTAESTSIPQLPITNRRPATRLGCAVPDFLYRDPDVSRAPNHPYWREISR